MLVRKILETTLAAGSTSVSFTDSDIPNSLIRVYSTDPDLMPVEQSLTGTTLTITYESQSSAKGIAVEMVKQGLEIVDNVTSTDTDKALSAKQGKVLKDAIDGIVIPTVPENITDLDDVAVSSIQNGQVLAWNSTSEKFENVNQSGGSGNNTYSTTETVVGTYNDKPLYRKIISGTFTTNETIVSGQIYAATISVSVANIDKLFADCDHSYYTVSSAIRGFIGIIVSDNNEIQPLTRFSRSDATYYIPIEYTKTTD